MTATKQEIAAGLRRIHNNRKGRVVIRLPGEPMPPHKPEDTYIEFTEVEKRFL